MRFCVIFGAVFAEMFIPTCGISVLLGFAVCGITKFGSRLSVTVKYLRC